MVISADYENSTGETIGGLLNATFGYVSTVPCLSPWIAV